MILNVHHFKVEIINHVIHIVIKVYEGNPDCYYGSGAASPDQPCYCYTDSSTSETVKPIESTENNMINIECTPLQGGNYAECNAYCNFRNSDCYYGNGAASSDKICYCYTDTGAALSGLKRGLITKDAIECTPLEGGNYNVCNANCYE
eukprot:1120853_1